MFILKGVKMNPVFCASGALNYGQGYWYDWFLYPWLNDWKQNITFISKTATFYPCKGNMPLRPNLQPVELFPSCIKAYPFKGAILNSVGLSNPGLIEVLNANPEWSLRKEPFVISIMAVGKTPEERTKELEGCILILKHFIEYCIQTNIAIQLNVSCPNTEHNPALLVNEAMFQLSILKCLDVPLILKINALTQIEVVLEIQARALADAITVSNTIPWGQLPEKINWKPFGRNGSPLKHLGGGGLSGAPIFEIVKDWITVARQHNITLPIIACGGIMSADNVKTIHDAGANAIEIGTAKLLRFWRLNDITKTAHQLFA